MVSYHQGPERDIEFLDTIEKLDRRGFLGTFQDMESFNDQPIARGVGDTATDASKPSGL